MTKFLNCNYPGRYKCPPGKPKELKPKMEIKKNKFTMYVNDTFEVWFKQSTEPFYSGIIFEPKMNKFGLISKGLTISCIGDDLYNWCGESLNVEEEELLRMYLTIIAHENVKKSMV